jgi:hypothetical protein
MQYPKNRTSVSHPASRTPRPWIAAAATILILLPKLALAYSTGITSNFFPIPANGCNFCHTGGTIPTVELLGPTNVSPGSTNEYTFRIFEVGSQSHGGLNASIALGTLGIGGAFSSGTQASLNMMSGLDEITHTMPKAAAGGMVEFSFLWTAPGSFTDATLTVWGNAVNFNSSTGGDGAAAAALLISSGAAGTPTSTPTVTPTATPTPTIENPCDADLAPANPASISDTDLRKCQAMLAKAGGLYAKKMMRAVQKCMSSYQKGKLIGPDPVTLCRGTLVGSAYTAPTDQKTADKIAKVDSKLRGLLQKKCTDSLVAQLDSCATTVGDLEDCVIEDHWQTVDGLLQVEFGNLFPSPDSTEQKCQKTIATEGYKFLTKSLKASQKCLDKRSKNGVGGDGAALCIGSVTSGTYTPPTDAKTAAKITKAESKLREKIERKCDSTALAGLDSCATDPMPESDCTVCSHRAAVVSLLDTEFGGD